MPGIFGIAGLRAPAHYFHDAIRAAHAVSGLQFHEFTCQSGDVFLMSLARVNANEVAKVIARDQASGAILLLEGEVFSPTTIVEKYGSRSEPLVDVLLKAYLSLGAPFVETLDGEFNILVYEPGASRICIYSDHVGSYPFYFWQVGQSVLFGSEKKCLLAATNGSRKLDAIGLLQPFVHQHNLADRTFIEGLRRLPPHSCLRLEARQVSLTTYGGGWTGESRGSKANTLLEQWEYLLKSATAKRLSEKRRLLVSLSSGLDSRAIACAFDRSRRPISARTMGHPDSFEVRYAAQIAAALKFDHSIENSLNFNYSDVARQIVWRTDGETDFRNGLSLAGHAHARRLGEDIAGGWLGDVTSGAHLRPFMLRPMSREDFINKVFHWYIQHTPEQLRLIFRKEFLDKHWPIVKQAFEESYAPFVDLPNTVAHEMWDICNRQARMTMSSMPVDSHLFGKVRPFFDRDYVAFSMSIPLRWRIGQNLYKSLIHRIGPEIRAIPNGNSNTLIHKSPISNLASYGWSLGGKVVSRFGPKIAGRKKNPGGVQVAMDMAAHLREDNGLRSIVEAFTRSSNFDEDVFDRMGIQKMLSAHYAGAADHSELICILASSAIALQYFFYTTKKSCPQEALPVH